MRSGVLWSSASVASDWVKEEAEIAKENGKIIPVFLEAVRAPFGFTRIEGANLADWDGDLIPSRMEKSALSFKSAHRSACTCCAPGH